MFRSWKTKLRELGQEARRAAQWSVSESRAGGTTPRNALIRWENAIQRLATHDERFRRLERAGYAVFELLRDWNVYKSAVERILDGTQALLVHWRDAASAHANVQRAGASSDVSASPSVLWRRWSERQHAIESRVLRVTEKRVRLRVLQPLDLAMNEGQVLLEGILGLLEEVQQVQASMRQANAQASAYGYAAAAATELYEGAMAPVIAKCNETCVHVEAWIAAHLDLLPDAINEMLEIQTQFYAGAAFVVAEERRLNATTQELPASKSTETSKTARSRPVEQANTVEQQHSGADLYMVAGQSSKTTETQTVDALKREHSWRELHERWRSSLAERQHVPETVHRPQPSVQRSATTRAAVDASPLATAPASSVEERHTLPVPESLPSAKRVQPVDAHPHGTPLVDVVPAVDQLVDIVDEPVTQETAADLSMNDSRRVGNASPWMDGGPEASRLPAGAALEQADAATTSRVDGTATERTLLRRQANSHERVDDIHGELREPPRNPQPSKSPELTKTFAIDAPCRAERTASTAELRVVEQQIRQWTRDGSRIHNIRALLCSLHEVLGDDSGWERLSVQSLIDEHQVRRAYRRALLLTHPDRGAANSVQEPMERCLRERVFDILRAAYKTTSGE